MADLKFELFVTTENGQVSLELTNKPFLMGTDSQCDVKMGQGDPAVKAIIQREGDVLLVKVFDLKHPVEINGKKYKSAKIKNSSFFKVGAIDIVASIEEVQAIIEEEYIEEDIIEEEFVDEAPQATQSKINLPDLPQPVSLPEEAPIEVNLQKENKVEEKAEEAVTKKQELPSEAQSAVVMTQSSYDDEFSFNIHFNDQEFKPEFFVSYTDQNYDYNEYIDLKDETKKELPQDIFEENAGHHIHIVHMSNGVVIEEEHFDPKYKRLFISEDFSDKKTLKVLDCKQHRSELVFVRDRKVFVVGQEGYSLHRVDSEDRIENINSPTVQLLNEERVILTKGTSQIVLTIVTSPPNIVHNPFMNMDDKLIKTTAIVWALAFVPLMFVMLLAELPNQKPKIKKELVVIYKKKKIEKPKQKKKQAPVENEVAKKAESEPKKAETKKQPQKKVAKREPKKQPKKVEKKVTKKKIAKKPVKKLNKKKVAKVNKAKKVQPKVTKVKAVSKPAPKKTYKFSSSSKLSALVGKKNTKLKAARSTSSVDVASTLGSSSSSLTQSYNAKNFGKSGVKVDSFGGGSRNGSRAGVGTSGLSGKRGASTAYIDANTKILGAMDPELIRKIMKEYIPQFRYCYQKELMKNPSVAGTFDLIFQINAYGKGINVGVKKNGRDFSRNAKRCLERVVKMIKFPRPKGGGLVDVRQPMNFYKQ